MKLKNKKNIVIASLLFIVLLMTVAFAAFQTNLTINGSSNINSNWCVGFDSSKTNTYVATAGITGATAPTGHMAYNGNTCQTSYKTIATLTSKFTQPGDKVVYTLTIANKSSSSAQIDSITVDSQSVTSDTTITKGNIKYKVEMPLATTLASNAETTMKVTAEFQNDTNIGNYTTSESASIDVRINTSEGSSGFTPTAAKYTGTIYRNNTTGANIGSSIVQVSGTKYVITDGNQDAPVGPYESQSECQTALEGFGSPAGYSCQQKTGTFGGVGEYTTNASTLNKTYYLKHDVVDDIITNSYVCFVTDTEHCMQGGDSNANKTLLQGQETWFNNHSGICSFDDSSAYCSGGGFGYVIAYSTGSVIAGVSGSTICEVSPTGYSDCFVS